MEVIIGILLTIGAIYISVLFINFARLCHNKWLIFDEK